MDTTRIEMLRQFLDQNPNDAFARYGYAMEFARMGEVEKALTEFDQLLKAHPDYSAGYFMAAQTLHKIGRNDEARKMLEGGISAARRTGNQHAMSEMQAMLDDLELQP